MPTTSPDSYLVDCFLKPREQNDTLFYIKNGEILARLQGYAIVPREEYEQLKRLKKLSLVRNP